jgi:DNA polymerase-3 subunit gamma/tau
VAGVEAPLALYRRYRPETFAEVIGQDHVTAPLRNALSNNRVNHAYLFSGPRGCGKTTSARILARAINCEKGPIAEPCGVCKSCTDLARGGPGSIDVIEIDAASHGGVDDARDLRERAFFAPVESRYKIYIIDEAHMVTTQGFNALLKLVEEPPPHLKFIFATTEPDKVIGTIRSRTHHYPFRLVPPKVLGDYMASLCQSEGVAIESAALPLVVRAGAGSVRDSLSVLDQLIGGAGPDGVTYELAVALLGFTPDSLLDACVDGFAAHDSAAVFETIEKVIETGQDPKRFAEDLLRRLRDLVVLSAVPNAGASGLIEAAEDQGERLQTQAAGIGSAELTRAADIVAAGLLEMRGATAPRLQLELICAKVLLPGADDSTNGIQARLDRIERRLTIGVPTSTPDAAPAQPSAAPSAPTGLAGGPAQDASASRVAARAAATSGTGGTPADGTTPPGATAGAGVAGATDAAPGADASTGAAAAGDGAGSAAGGGGGSAAANGGAADADGRAGAGGGAAAGGGSAGGAVGVPGSGAGTAARGEGAVDGAAAGSGSVVAGAGRTGAWGDESAPVAAEQGAGGASTAVTGGAPAGGGAGAPSGGSVGLADIRRLWPEVLEAVKSKRRFAWIMLSQNAQVIGVDDQTLTLGLVNAGARESFARSGSDEILRQAMIDTIGLNRRIEAVVDPSTDPGAGGGHQPAGPRPGGPQTGNPGSGGPGSGGPSAGGSGSGGSGSGGSGSGGPGAGGSSTGAGVGGPAAGGAAGPGVGGQAVDGSGAGGPGARGAGAGRTGAGALGAGGAGSSGPAGGLGAGGSVAGRLEANGSDAGPGGRGGAAAGGPGGSASGGVGFGGAESRTGPWGTGDAAGPGGSAGSRGAGGDESVGGQSPVNPGGSAGSGGAGGSSGAGQWGDGRGTAVALQEPPDPEYDDVPPEPDPWDDVPARQGPRAGRAGGAGTRTPGAGPSAGTAGQSGGTAGQSGRTAAQSGRTAGQASGADRREQAASKRRAAEAAVAAEQARAAAAPAAPVVPLTPEEEADAIGEDDVVLEEDSRTHTDLLRETLGAQIITEEPN